MPSSYTTSIRLVKPQTGELVNTWGLVLNSGVFDKVDYAVAGWLSLPVNANTTLTVSNASDDQARAAMIRFTGAGGYNVVIPSVSKTYDLHNDASALIIITTGSGATVQVDPGDIVRVTCDGTNVRQLGYGGLGLKAYISAAVLGATGALPATAGNAGKFVYTDGTSSYWKTINLADVADYAADRGNILDEATALAVAL